MVLIVFFLKVDDQVSVISVVVVVAAAVVVAVAAEQHVLQRVVDYMQPQQLNAQLPAYDLSVLLQLVLLKAQIEVLSMALELSTGDREYSVMVDVIVTLMPTIWIE
jgi:hypothetical protein